ncbi:MAG: GrdX family protein [Atopobiaceae bacterium]|jgi:hypothetical protein
MVISNNPLLRDEPDVTFVEGGFRDVLIAARDLVHMGYSLVSHPLFASLGMMFSPYRTIILSDARHEPNSVEAEIIEGSIMSYDLTTEGRQRIERNDHDYALMDRELYLAALEEAHALAQM